MRFSGLPLATAFAATLAFALPFLPPAAAQTPSPPAAAPMPPAKASKASIVLVHGAFADASSWARVIPILEKDGYYVIAVQNPLTSLADDVATTRRAIAAQTGPTIVVGHSYGGTVISAAATDQPNVRALVYVAALAPDAGESITTLNQKYPAPPLSTALSPDAGGFIYIDRAKFQDVFAADVPEKETRIMAATQKPILGAIFQTPLDVSAPAWKAAPSYYLVATQDRAINPDLERWMAKRIGARTVEVRASHVPFLSHPKDVAALIEEAAQAAIRPPAR